MFDRIAARYDRLNRILSFGVDQRWRRLAVEALGLEGTRPTDEASRPSASATPTPTPTPTPATAAAAAAAGPVLDLATGTGDLALAVLRRYPGTTVVGADPSPGMLAVAARKAAAAGVGPRFLPCRGDGQRLPFASERFAAAAIAFGIRNVPDRARALTELFRVLRPGGRLAVLEASEPRRGLLGPLARLHIHRIVPLLGGLLSGRREYAYLQRSIAAFPPPAAFVALLRQCGFVEVAARPLTAGVCVLYTGVRPARTDSPD